MPHPPGQQKKQFDNASAVLADLMAQQGDLHNQLSSNGQQVNELERHLRATNAAYDQAAKAHKEAKKHMLKAKARLNVHKGMPDENNHQRNFNDAQAALDQAQTALHLATQNRQDAQNQRETLVASLNQSCQDIQAQLDDIAIQYQEALDQQNQAMQ